jgi:hypothetical protein
MRHRFILVQVCGTLCPVWSRYLFLVCLSLHGAVDDKLPGICDAINRIPIGDPHQLSLYRLGGGVIDRVLISSHVGFLVCYKKIYKIELFSKYILICLVFQVDEVPGLGWARCVACLVYPVLLELFLMR